MSLNRLELRGQTVIQAIVRDITGRKQAEAAQHDAEQLYRTLVNTSPDGIALLDLSGRILYSSPKTLELFYGSAEAEPPAGPAGLELVAKQDRSRARQAAPAGAGGSISAQRTPGHAPQRRTRICGRAERHGWCCDALGRAVGHDARHPRCHRTPAAGRRIEKQEQSNWNVSPTPFRTISEVR